MEFIAFCIGEGLAFSRLAMPAFFVCVLIGEGKCGLCAGPADADKGRGFIGPGLKNAMAKRRCGGIRSRDFYARLFMFGFLCSPLAVFMPWK